MKEMLGIAKIWNFLYETKTTVGARKHCGLYRNDGNLTETINQMPQKTCCTKTVFFNKRPRKWHLGATII